MSLSLYNKYRPQTFTDVVGQEHVEKTLANAVLTNSVSHAYLFTGSRGTGKTTTARLLAKALLCEQAPTPDPDGTCQQCREISEGVHPDVYELDAASRTGVDNVREEIIGRVQYAPTHGDYKIYIIDEVHMLSTAAFNALLKTLEEPPTHVVFVLCTTDAQKVPDTVVARCQRFDFHRFSTEQISGRLRYICEQEGFSFEERAVDLIARRSAGGMRDAIGALEQVAVFGGGEVSWIAAESMFGEVSDVQMAALALLVANRDVTGCFEWVADFVQSGSDIATLVNDLAVYVRNLYVLAVSNQNDERLAAVLEVNPLAIENLREQVATFGASDRLAFVLTVLGDLSSELKDAANARLALEIALTKMVRPQSSLTLEALAARIAVLESGTVVNANAAVRPTVPETSVPPLANSTARSSVSEVEINSSSSSGNSSSASSSSSGSSSSSSTDSMTSTNPINVKTSVTDSILEEPPVSAASAEADYQLWDRVVDYIKTNKTLIAMSLGGSQPHLDASKTALTIELPPTAGLAKQLLDEPDNIKFVTDAVFKVSKKPISIRYVLGQEPIAVNSPDLEIDGILLEEEASEPVPEALPEPTPEPISEASEPISEVIPETIEPISEPELEPEPDSKLESTSDSTPEPTKEELESILSASFNSTIKFEEL